MSIELILGNMFAGKSSRLLTRLKRFQIAKKKCICVKYCHDRRYENVRKRPDTTSKQEGTVLVSLDVSFKETKQPDSPREVVTHRGDRWPALSCECISEIMDTLKEYDVIGIDEIQFFHPHSVECVNKLANQGKIVVVSGLNATKSQKMWFVPMFVCMPNVVALLPWCENIIHEKAICDICGDECHLTVGIVPESPNKTIPSGATNLKSPPSSEIDVGGSEKYAPRCRRCFCNML